MLTLLDPNQANEPFPPPQQALAEPPGLLAVGGCLSQPRLLNAYRRGIFPWYNSEQVILWWSPDPRLVLYPEQFKPARSLRKKIKKAPFQISFNQAFADIIDACSKPRSNQEGTWISDEMKAAYLALHKTGHAHSVEVWAEQKLVGGLYGISIGQVFFGESMFHTQTDASKIAFAFLIEKLNLWGYQLVDCQVHSKHLLSLGAIEIPRTKFNYYLDQYCPENSDASAWTVIP